MKKVYVVGAKRSAIGSFMGTLATVHPAEVGKQVLQALLKESNVKPDTIDEVLVGNILSAGLGQNVGRQISIFTGMPSSVPASTLNMVCGSGMKTVMNAYTSISAGLADVMVAGGVESMSGAPFLVTGQFRKGIKMGEQPLRDHMLYDALTDVFNGYHMGVTAENIAEKYSISREAQDAFAWESQKRAIAADDAGKFKDEIVPILIKQRKGDIIFAKDEFINRRTSLEKLGTLRTVFKKDGTVTAGSSSGINDGASFLIVAGEDAVKKYQLKPLFEIIGIGQGGVDPSVMGLGPTPAIKQAIKRAGIAFEDLDLIELNEAFAAQSLGVIHELEEAFGVKPEDVLRKTNVNGGAIALGHPVGASGNRIIVTLIHEMLKTKSNYGLASLCIGGGMGTAVILKKV